MDAERFIALAGRLVAMHPHDEASLRTAVSRSYYGAFHLAREFLAEVGHPPGENHGVVTRYLLHAGNRDCRRAGQLLSDLQSERVTADYELTDTRFQRTQRAMQSVEDARSIESSLSACSDQEAMHIIAHAIQDYRDKTNQ